MKSHVWIFLLISISTFIDGEFHFDDWNFLLAIREKSDGDGKRVFSNQNNKSLLVAITSAFWMMEIGLRAIKIYFKTLQKPSS